MYTNQAIAIQMAAILRQRFRSSAQNQNPTLSGRLDQMQATFHFESKFAQPSDRNARQLEPE